MHFIFRKSIQCLNAIVGFDCPISFSRKKYTDAVTANDVAGAATAMAEYKKLQTTITKTQKKLEKLYESSGKK